jgi:hypothetical protein
MRAQKERVTITLDKALVRAGSHAVATGRAESFSAWINSALAERVAKERRLLAMAQALDAYEAKHGVISDAELEAQARDIRAGAIVVRGKRKPSRPRKRSGKAA